MRLSAIIVFILINVTSTFAQSDVAAEKDAYVKVITARANKLVAGLKLNDEAKAEKVSLIVRDQYSDLNDVYAKRDLNIKAIKEQYQDKTEREAALQKENANV